MPDTHGWTALTATAATYSAPSASAQTWTDPSNASAPGWSTVAEASQTWVASNATDTTWTTPRSVDSLSAGFWKLHDAQDDDIGVDFFYKVEFPATWRVTTTSPIGLYDSAISDPRPGHA